ncbi:MAG: hypothetical protein AUK54_07370 [Helicobacteraceae bacterium CG2_30_36_10]|nr:MAG: hypothetical protein AUK54_07370 [Helicobacteraceae bacterium CG2_30_36_10]
MTAIEKKQLKSYLEGSDSQPALNGGYLYIYLNNNLLTIVSIPSPNLMADNSSQSTVENDDEFQDKDGNDYSIIVLSSMYGIDWRLDTYPEDENIIKKISYEVKRNEY